MVIGSSKSRLFPLAIIETAAASSYVTVQRSPEIINLQLFMDQNTRKIIREDK